MNEERDETVDLIMRRKLLELQRKASMQARTQAKPAEKPPREVVAAFLYDRGEEVMKAAESQYPTETKLIEEKLAELIKSGRLKDRISGGALLWLFRQFGLDVRIETTIRVEKDGKMVSLADKLKGDA
jgi:DNA-binding TFAR19-related protein (PDSD5 family)